MFDFNNDQEQKLVGGLIPDDTLVMVMTSIRAGGYGPGGWMTRKDSGVAFLDFEFTVVGGEYDKRKFWKEFMLEGDGSDRHNTAVAISRGMLRGMIEGAKGINPKDNSPEAAKARQVEGFNFFHLLRVPCLVGVEVGGPKDKNNPKGEQWPDKNKPKLFLVPGMEDYAHPGEQEPRPALQAVVTQRQPANGNGGGFQGGGQGGGFQGQAQQQVQSGGAKPAWAA